MKVVLVCWWVSAGKNWSWKTFFKKKGTARQANNWGGPEWIRSTVSHARIKEMRAGEYVIAYQAGSGVVGIAQLKSDGYKAAGSPHFDTFDLCSSPAIWFENAIPLTVIKALPGAVETFEFIRSARGTVFSVGKGGLERIMNLAAAFNPNVRMRLIRISVK